MPLILPGYSVRRTLRSSERLQVYEAERSRDGRRVVAKLFEFDQPGVLARVEHEFRILRELDVEGVVRPIGVERSGEHLVLLLDYVDGPNLAEYAGGQALALDRLLVIACALTRILAQVHARRVVHRDLKPSNILIERGSEAVYLADFGISVLLESERAQLYDPRLLVGTLPYISPEQTGRIRREVDQRSDLYSLGVTLYELATGRRPFVAAAPLELVHAHLAKQPPAPAALVDGFPPLLSALIMRLLEKAPEHRYQSAAGLLADLDRLRDALAAGQRDVAFPLAERDFPHALQLPHQLYGRERERERLAAELDATVAARRRAFVVIRGEAGLGKSALVRGLEGPLAALGGSMAIGKFEPRAAGQVADRPYHAFARAIAGLVEQWLSEPEDRLRAWRTRLAGALGPIAGAMVALVPELRLVLSEVPELPAVELGEGRNRVHVAVSRTLAAIAQTGPLLLVLEDLQWADAASLELLRSLRGDGLGPTLIIATCRPEFELDELAGFAAAIELGPLAEAELARMLADVLRRPLAAVAELAELVARRTGGNPLFVRAFLAHLVDLGLLAPGPAGWTWAIEELAAAPLPDDLLRFMTARLERLAPEQLAVLQVAAAIGSGFDTGLVEAVAAQTTPEVDVAEALFALEREGLISARGEGHQFGHDRIGEAALELLAPERRRALHWTIGKALAAAVRARGEDPGFSIVDQLDAGLGDLDALDRDERLELARLNRDAGERALATGAWEVARRYFACAVELLAPQLDAARGGAGERGLVFAAHFGLAQASALAGETARASEAFAELSRWQLSLVEDAQVVARRVQIAALAQRMTEAIELGLAGLARCGFTLPAKPTPAALAGPVMRAWWALRDVDRERLLALPKATDERVLAAAHVITMLASPAFVVAPTLHVLLTALHVRLVLRHGYHESAPEAFAQIAIVISAMGDPRRAGQLCSDAQALTRARPTSVATALRTEAMVLLFVGPTHMPFRSCAEPIEAACRRAIEAGERQNAGYFGALGLALQLEAGAHLAELPELAERLSRENPGWGEREMAVVAELTLRFAATLRGEPADADDRAPGFMRRAELAELDISELTQYATVVVELGGRMLLALAGGTLDDELDSLWALAEGIAGDYQKVLLNTWQASRFAMLSAILAATMAARGRLGSRRAIALIRKRLAALRKAADGCAANYGPMASIVEGELERLRGRADAAAAAYEAARELAADYGSAYLVGLANLRTAALADALGWRTTAAGARSLALASFRGWGANRLVALLEQAHPELRGRTPTLAEPATAHGGPVELGTQLSASTSTSDLDLASVLGTMQLISADLRLDEVVARVLGAAIASAGADRGALLLELDGQITLVARGRAGSETEFLAEPVPLRRAEHELPSAVIRYVLRTGNPAVVDELATDARFAADPYVRSSGVRSLLCMPISKQRERVGALVLENHLTPGAFGPERLEVLRMLVAQAAGALDNARLYAALARSEAQWRSLVDGAPDSIALLDARGRIELINHLQPFALAGAELIGQPLERVLDEASLAAWREAFAAVLVGSGPRELELCVAPRGAGQDRRWYATRLAPIEVTGDRSGPGDRPAVAKVLAIATDVTEHKRLETQLRQQQRLESIGTLASGVAHEINNPIQGILNYAELMSERAEDSRTVTEFAAEITNESHRVATIVRNLLAFSRQEREQQFETVEVRAVLDATLSLIRAVLRKDQVRCELDVPDGVPAIRCRPQQIQQVVMNLVTNARDALNGRYPGYDPNKRIDIRVSQPHPQRVRISVADRGTGIPDEVRAHIFDPFFTTKGRDQGTGLGLSVSHGIVADHGGELTVESELGVGTTFHLDLPARRG